MIVVKDFETLSDKEAVSRIVDGEISLYELIVRRYNPYLFKIGKSYGFSQPDTEDIIQDTFISAYSNLSKFENRSSVKTWLVKIMLNCCYHKKLKAAHQNEVSSNELENQHHTPMFTNSNSNTASVVMNNELKHILETSLVNIPEDYRIVFTLRELNGMNTAETAEALNITEANTKVRLLRAKNMLRKEIEKMYVPEEIFEFNLIYCNRIVQNVFAQISRTSPKSSNPFLLNIKKKISSWVSGRTQ
ncbi:MAG TPA: sigma-70 family RNA polymerase sigma factor [Salinimicrobium sp.]|nr:sigma-70 family RNA polymerase sigma factor [Salinimicrobium sp.]